MDQATIHQFKQSEQRSLTNWLNLPQDQDPQYFMHDFTRRLVRIENPKQTHYLMAFHGQLALENGTYIPIQDAISSDSLPHFDFSDAEIESPPSHDPSKHYYVLYELPLVITNKKELTELKAVLITQANPRGGQACMDYVIRYAELNPAHASVHTIFYKGAQNLLGSLNELCTITDPLLNIQASFSSHIVLGKDQIKISLSGYGMAHSSDGLHLYYADNEWHYMDLSIPEYETNDLFSQLLALPVPSLEKLCQLDAELKSKMQDRLGFVPEKLVDLELTLFGRDTIQGNTLKKWTHPKLAEETDCRIIHDQIHGHCFAKAPFPQSKKWHQLPLVWALSIFSLIYFPITTLSLGTLLFAGIKYNERQIKPSILLDRLPAIDLQNNRLREMSQVRRQSSAYDELQPQTVQQPQPRV